MRRLRYALAPLLLAAVSCHDITVPLEPCTGAVALTVAPERPHTISWSPRCTARELLVIQSPSQGSAIIKWRVHSPRSLMEPGFFYGQVPRNAEEITSATPLPERYFVAFVLLSHTEQIGSFTLQLP
jgi:hypothetical protein